MPIPRTGPITRASCYHDSLLSAINQFLPRRIFASGNEAASLRWSERLLVLCILCMTWDVSATLADRFESARRCVVKMFPGRRRPGRTYQGFMAAMKNVSEPLLAKLSDHLRGEVRRAAADHWRHKGFVPIGADGSKAECPKTAGNEQAFGCAGKKRSTPQQFITTLLHLGTGLVWAFVTGPARSSERAHLRQMLCTLPERSLLIADAGFTGYDLLEAILSGGKDFLIRVGSNVRLLTKLGFAVEERGQTVYLWPEGRRKTDPPLVLRLITLVDGRNRRMHLLSSVLDETAMADETACEFYTMRWGVELYYRALKQTMARRKLAGDAPATAQVELNWAMMGLWLLCLMGTAAIIETKQQNPRRLSVARALRLMRRAMRDPARRAGSAGLTRQLSRATIDRYQRKASKRARDWTHKKKPKPIGDPKARNAKLSEVLLAKRFQEHRAAA